jgi:hypothetical protein
LIAWGIIKFRGSYMIQPEVNDYHQRLQLHVKEEIKEGQLVVLKGTNLLDVIPSYVHDEIVHSSLLVDFLVRDHHPMNILDGDGRRGRRRDGEVREPVHCGMRWKDGGGLFGGGFGSLEVGLGGHVEREERTREVVVGGERRSARDHRKLIKSRQLFSSR